MQKLKDSEEVLAARAYDLNAKRTELKSYLTRLTSELLRDQQTFADDIKAKEGQASSEVKSLELAIQGCSSSLDSAANDIKDKRDTEKRAADLRLQLLAEEELLMEQVADKEKDKVIETHKLTINIGKKIEETKSALQDLKKEQLETTRRYAAVRQADRATEQSTH